MAGNNIECFDTSGHAIASQCTPAAGVARAQTSAVKSCSALFIFVHDRFRVVIWWLAMDIVALG
jgi:hypothetical protein